MALCSRSEGHFIHAYMRLITEVKLFSKILSGENDHVNINNIQQAVTLHIQDLILMFKLGNVVNIMLIQMILTNPNPNINILCKLLDTSLTQRRISNIYWYF